MQRHAFVTKLGAGPQLAEVPADNVSVEDRQPDSADVGGQCEQEFELDAGTRANGHGDDRVELALELMRPEFDDRALAGRMPGRIGRGGDGADLRPDLA